MSDRKISSIAWLALSLLLLIVLFGMIYGNYVFAKVSAGGTDFLVHWVGTRVLLFSGESPYTDEAALQIQTITYGRAALPGEHELRVAYPLYSTLVFGPFALFENFALARAVWMTFLEVCLVVLAILCLRLFQWKPALGTFVVYLLFSLFWYKAIRGIINGNAVIVVALLIAFSIWAIRDNRDALAGISLALMTIKPHVVLLYFVFVLFWALSQRRWQLIGWMLVSVLGLILISMVFIPDWLMQNLKEVLRYPGYNPAGTAGAALKEIFPGVGSYLSIALTILIAAILVYEWYSAWGKGYSGFLWGVCSTLVLSQLIGIQTDPGNFIILFAPLVYVFAGWQKKGGRRGEWAAITLMVGLFSGLWILFIVTVQGTQQHPVMFFPLPIVLLLGLYSVRGVRGQFESEKR